MKSRKENSISSGDPLDRLRDFKIDKTIIDKLNFLGDTVKELKALIEERKKLRRKLMMDISDQINHVRSLLLQFDTLLVPNNSRERMSLENELSFLEKDKRTQELLEWQDLDRLKRELREAEEKYRDMLRSIGLLVALK